MENFNELQLPDALRASLNAMKFEKPTPIQARAIPFALEGKDVLGTAQTGSGKTAAFGIPLVAKLMSSPRGSALVLLPTRELAQQVVTVLQQLLGRQKSIGTALLIGGDSMPKQMQALRARPRIIVGTPGRINDHLARGTLMLADANFLVLDETDRMLDMGFGIQLEKIFQYLPKQRQTLMFSATMPREIIKITERHLNQPERVAIGEATKAAVNIKQEEIHVSHEQKYPELLKQLSEREGSVIIFVKTKRGADRLADKLRRANHSADAIHGDLQQNKRDRVIRAFREKRHRILVATDIAARGLDIPHIEHVINFDLPQCPEDFIHRIGRTARAGAEGSALCLISPDDNDKWRAIQRLMNPGAPQEKRLHHEPGKGNPRRSRNRRRFSGDKKGGEGQARREGAPRREGGSHNAGSGNKKPFRFKRRPRRSGGGGNGGQAAA
ncbi:MAG: DEAD/DEAH box helicase [Rickettsiales bacterium]